ncbi:MAG: hypothetical protein NVS2B4_00090 [Ramlibacter sp.]
MADLQDEIQVYDDAINAAGEPGLEVHVNATPNGRRFGNYQGEIPPAGAVRVTPELSWGATRTMELGLYLPSVLRSSRYELAGAKVRLKYLPLQPSESQGAFAGVNLELSRLKYRYSESRTSLESRFIVGWRGREWLMAANPIVGAGLSPGYAGQRPDFSLGAKVSRRVSAGLAAGVETYSQMGPIGRPLPWMEQDQKVFLVLDVDRAPWVFNIGIGHGMTKASDRTTVKAIFEIPLATKG